MTDLVVSINDAFGKDEQVLSLRAHLIPIPVL